MLDEEGKPKDSQKTFTIAICEFIANGCHPSLEYFKTLHSKQRYKTLNTRETVINDLIKLQTNAPKKYETSIMNNEK